MIAQNTVVSLNYRLTKNNEAGELIEETYGNQPLTFIYGIGMMIPKFEQELNGLKAGDKFSFGIAAADAYGVNDPNMVVNVPMDIFKGQDGKVDSEVVKVGNVLPMQDNQGNRMNGKIIEIAGDQVRMDFNHPLAGQDLHFTGDIISTREATKEELEHGHVHGEGGHQH
jgi:FKBP-type peptidyl-prolyl cis-trans isomerase SlyD